MERQELNDIYFRETNGDKKYLKMSVSEGYTHWLENIIISEIKKQTNSVEAHLRRKCKRYHKHVKGLQRGIKWRDELITELIQRLGYVDENITLSSNDFKKLMEGVL